MIGVIDYRAGNAPSVMYALERLGLDARLVAEPAGVDGVDRLILPGRRRRPRHHRLARGVRAPRTAARPRSWTTASRSSGICIGLQVLFERSEEGPVDGLGWLEGEVRRFPDTDRVPQIGWNAVRFTRAAPRHRGPAGLHATATS